jgi:hypothetical protein
VGLSPEGGLGGVGGSDSSAGRGSPAAGMEKRSLGGCHFCASKKKKMEGEARSVVGKRSRTEAAMEA